MIEAVSAELAFPAAIQRFSEGIRLIMESSATFQTDLSVMDAQGVSRERVDALMEAAGKHVVATPCISVTLAYRVPRVGEAERDESSVYMREQKNVVSNIQKNNTSTTSGRTRRAD